MQDAASPSAEKIRKKGVLELCVLSLLHKRDCYGYEISEYLSRHIDIADGTVYPILRKLKADGLLTTYLQEESGGPPRASTTGSPRSDAKLTAATSQSISNSRRRSEICWRKHKMTKHEFMTQLADALHKKSVACAQPH